MKNKFSQLKKSNHEDGFTLVEMLIVLFIIGALLLVIMPSLTGAGKDAQAKACEANKKMISAQAENYYLNHGNEYPDDVGELFSEGYLSDTPVCPALAGEEDDSTETGGSNGSGGSEHYQIARDGTVTCIHHDHDDQ